MYPYTLTQKVDPDLFLFPDYIHFFFSNTISFFQTQEAKALVYVKVGKRDRGENTQTTKVRVGT